MEKGLGVFKIFAKFTGKHLRQSLFFSKVAGLRPATLLRRDPSIGVFLSILCNFKNTFFTQHLRKTASIYLQRHSQEPRKHLRLRAFTTLTNDF